MKREKTFIAFILLLASILPLSCPYLYSDLPVAVRIVCYLSAFSLVTFIVALGCRVRTIGVIAFPVMAIVNLVSSYTFFVCKQYYNDVIFAKILETDINEAEPYLTVLNISIAIVVSGGCLVLPFIGYKVVRSRILGIVSLCAFFLFGCCFYISKRHVTLPEKNVFKLEKMYNGMDYASCWPVWEVYKTCKHYMWYKKYLSAFIQLKKLPTGYVEPTEDEVRDRPDDMVVTLMIGEAVRADHLHFNGYGRDTMPGLGKRVAQIVSYPKTCSFGLLTTTSWFGILTDAECIGRTAYHKPLPDITTRDGVATVFCGRDTPFCGYFLNDSVVMYSPGGGEPEHHVFERTEEDFRRALQEQSQADRLFLIACNDGAHHPYRSLPGNKRFLPEDTSLLGAMGHLPELVNAYDNALLEIGWCVDSMIQSLEDMHRPAVFIYASDHGEMLGENGKLLHGTFDKPVYSPAIFVWCSKEFIEQYPEKYEALKSNTCKMITHDHLMHTVLSLLGYRRGVYKSHLDLTSKDAEEGEVPESYEQFSERKLGELAE